MTVRHMLEVGDFNDMSQVTQPDSTLLVTLSRRNDPHVYKMWVRDLYKPSEVVVKEEIAGA